MRFFYPLVRDRLASHRARALVGGLGPLGTHRIQTTYLRQVGLSVDSAALDRLEDSILQFTLRRVVNC